MTKEPNANIKTLTLTNFKGALSPQLHGPIDSGFSPWGYNSVGYDTLWNNYKGGYLDIMEAPSQIAGTVVTATILHFARAQNAKNQAGSQTFIYGVDNAGNVYEIEAVTNSSGWKPDYDTATKFGNTTGTVPTIAFGGGMIASAVNTQGVYLQLYVAYDAGISRCSLFGGVSIDPTTSTWTQLSFTSGGYIKNIPHPFAEFLNALVFGNGSNIAYSSDGATVNGAKLNPGFPPNYIIRDLAVSPDGTYLAILLTDLQGALGTLGVDPTNTTSINYPPNSAIAFWNGSDVNYSSIQFFKGINLTSIGVSNTDMIFVGTDDEGLGIWSANGNKLASLPNYTNTSAFRPPISQTTESIGNKFFFQADSGDTIWTFCFDLSDRSIYPLAANAYSTTPIMGGVAIPTLKVNLVSSNAYSDVARPKIYFSNSGNLYSLHLQNIYGGNANTGAMFQTQFEKLPRKADIKEVRVYSVNTSAGVSYSITLKTSFSNQANNSFTYTYSSADGVKNCVKWTPHLKPMTEIGVLVSNLGTVNPLISKIEIDYEEVDEVPVL